MFVDWPRQRQRHDLDSRRKNDVFSFYSNSDNDIISSFQVLGVSGFVDLWHLPAYYELRTDPKLYSLFAQVLRDTQLTVSLDRVSMKPPAWIEKEGTSSHKSIFGNVTIKVNHCLVVDGQVTKLTFPRLHGKLSVHTDLNLWYLDGPAYQGSVCLSDCPLGGGGFVCLPGTSVYNNLTS